MAGMLNRKAVRRFLLDYAAGHRAHRFTRVSETVYAVLESGLRDSCRKLVNQQPSAGKTIS